MVRIATTSECFFVHSSLWRRHSIHLEPRWKKMQESFFSPVISPEQEWKRKVNWKLNYRCRMRLWLKRDESATCSSDCSCFRLRLIIVATLQFSPSQLSYLISPWNESKLIFTWNDKLFSPQFLRISLDYLLVNYVWFEEEKL